MKLDAPMWVPSRQAAKTARCAVSGRNFRLSQPAGLIKQFVESAASHFQTILEFSRDFPIKSDKLLNAPLLSAAQRVELRFARAR
jgi:hypothetical protein